MENPSRVVNRVSLKELNRRWQLVREHMNQQGLDVLIAQGTPDFLSGYTKWLSGFGSSGYRKVVLFYRNDPMTIIEHGPFGGRKCPAATDEEYPGVGEVISTSAIASIHYTRDYEAKLVVEELIRRGCRKAGLVGPTAMAHGFASRIEQAFAGKMELTDETEFLDASKAVKSAEEIEELKKTCAMQDLAFAKVLESIRPGMRDFEITALADYCCRQHGSGQGIVLGSSQALGRPAVLAENQFQGRKTDRGDHFTLLIEMNGSGGFYAEVARTFVLGKASAELVETCEMLKEAQTHSVRQFKPGTLCSDIARSHDAFMTQHGSGPELRLYAHGQGYDLVERPLIRHDESMKLAGNMFLACHPVSVTGSAFVNLCDNFLINDAGKAERVHTTPQKIFEI